ncbi:MAG: cytochrome c oxidase assembly protein [Bacteroidetes bacterium]|nr:cytochrome c oxidase assembly protein [Rhodothermia bacterium]MCS7154928.1 cytochrome c oxidase assembly protein [Bacteroidota bacterium]MCX7906913.1 cytochrome c oxidase assembly protein [Bacteroidota bacterium]MDW8137723.1 cytochrome c oxidase assembly protein [Bacteroidota bacterium]MDW8285323.1 cytochrome c oxidase assembly protein [Bacteroidota bacterium]
MDRDRRNRVLLLSLVFIAAAMFGFAFVNVPLFQVLCRALGINLSPNNPQAAAPAQGPTREVRVGFVASVADGLPLRLQVQEALQRYRLGERGQNLYWVENLSADTVYFRAIHSVVPEDAARKMSLLECFCFDDITLAPRERRELPVIYVFSRDLRPEVGRITMSYTLYRRNPDERTPAR